MKRGTYVALLAVAVCLACIGVSLVWLMLQPSDTVIECRDRAVEIVTKPIEAIAGMVKPDEVTLDYEDEPGVLAVSNYPMLELGDTRYTVDVSKVKQAADLLKGARFKRWYGYASYEAKNRLMVGGYNGTLELYTTDGKTLLQVSYDPGYEGNKGPGVYVRDGDVVYVMEGDQKPVDDFIDQCVMDAYDQTCLPDPETARDNGLARTWLFEDEVSGIQSGRKSGSVSSSCTSRETK